MAQVKLGFKSLNVPEKIVTARNIVTKLTGNPAYVTPNPTLASISAAADDLETAANDASDGSISKKNIEREKEKDLDDKITLLVAYVQDESKGDKDKILSSGMGARADKSPPQDMPAPQNLSAKTGKSEGEIILRHNPVPKSKAYLYQQSADGATNWQMLPDSSTKATVVISKLPTGTKIWFRVCAVGPKGNGPWSDPARGLVA